MQREDILSFIRENLAEITDSEDLVLTEASTPDSTLRWDSINHMKLLVSLEDLGVSFSVSELSLPTSAGALVDLIQSKLPG